ncbi:MAG: hypothetical protein IPJ81_18430 [Chitinophagaceae bacterium]|nr:hypothetical protein [Chitinophagaceae bacterium]
MTVKDIVQKSYELFEKYTIGKTLEVCKVCCVTDKQEKELANTPLMAIPS